MFSRMPGTVAASIPKQDQHDLSQLQPVLPGAHLVLDVLVHVFFLYSYDVHINIQCYYMLVFV